MGDPGSFDNQILGQTGDWVWIAMKGPGDPPIPQLVWGYRQWNRVLAVNTQTKQMHVFSIPKGTSPVYSWDVTPGFGVIGNTVYVGTGNWLGAFPTNPTDESSLPPDPASMKSHFHSTPPTAVPGYKIVNGYYVKG